MKKINNLDSRTFKKSSLSLALSATVLAGFSFQGIAAEEDELEKIEKPAGIANPKDFRSEVVNFVLRAKAKNKGKNPDWTSYEKLREIIEKKM